MEKSKRRFSTATALNHTLSQIIYTCKIHLHMCIKPQQNEYSVHWKTAAKQSNFSYNNRILTEYQPYDLSSLYTYYEKHKELYKMWKVLLTNTHTSLARQNKIKEETAVLNIALSLFTSTSYYDDIYKIHKYILYIPYISNIPVHFHWTNTTKIINCILSLSFSFIKISYRIVWAQ